MTTTPAIPNSDRIVSYSPVVPTSAFVVPWPVIADSEALAENDLVVQIAGVALSTSLFSFTGNAIPGLSGMWNGGTVTLTTAVSGVRVIIYSKRDPQRTGNFLEGKTLPFTTLDKLGDDVTVQMRDLALSAGRAFKTSAANYNDNGSAEMSFSAGTLESVVAAFLAGVTPATAVAGWGRTLANAKALYAAPVVLANGHTISVAMRSAVGDGYGGLFTYDSADVASTFSQDALGFVDNQSRRFKRVMAAGTFALASWFGAVGDGATNDQTALQSALTTSRAVLLDAKTYLYNGVLTPPANTKLMGCGPATKISGDNVIKIDVSVANVHLCDFSFIGDGSEVIQVGKNATASNVIIERVHFVPTVANHLDRCVSLYNCNNVRIDKCNFVSTGYGVIHEASAYTVNNLKVTNCYASDMYGDLVLLNGGGGIATDVEIEGNSFMGSNNWTVPATERRFVGLTSVNSIKILNNYVQNCAGDAAIHCEDIGGRLTIAGNHLIDCGVSGGNDGYIWLLNSNKNAIITGNWFVRTSASAGTAFISSLAYSDEVLIFGNHFKDTSGHVAIAMDLNSHLGQVMINGNYCFGCDQFVQIGGESYLQIRDNTIESINYGLKGNSAQHIRMFGNDFSCAINSILTTLGTDWTIVGNAFQTGDVSGTNMTDVFMSGNSFGSGLATNSMALGGPVRVVQAGLNFKVGTGAV